MALNTLIRAARVPFLLLTPSCISFAYALASLSQATPNLFHTLVILVGALAAHSAVNLLNEYQDFHSGLDLITQKTPFSGGSGALPADPESDKIVLYGVWGCFALVIGCGLYLLQTLEQFDVTFVIIGVSGLLLIATYTRWINRLPLICLMASGFGFGTLMVLGSVLLLAGQITPLALLLSFIPFCQVNNLLLLSQYPDIDADKSVGRFHILIAYGPKSGYVAYAVMMVIPLVIIIGAVAAEQLPMLSLIATLPCVAGFWILRGLCRLGGRIGEQPQYLAANVAQTLLTPVLVAISILF